MIDLSTAPVVPSVGSRAHIISGCPQDVLSNTQIMRGKMSRADRPGPVRDVYDVIRTSMDDATAAELTAAYNLLIEIEQDAIESAWVAMDAAYEEDAQDQLRLTEPPCSDLSILGSTAARILHDHRLERVVVAIDEGRLRVDRTTRHGRRFTDFPGPENPVDRRGARRLRVHRGTRRHSRQHPRARRTDPGRRCRRRDLRHRRGPSGPTEVAPSHSPSSGSSVGRPRGSAALPRPAAPGAPVTVCPLSDGFSAVRPALPRRRLVPPPSTWRGPPIRWRVASVAASFRRR